MSTSTSTSVNTNTLSILGDRAQYKVVLLGAALELWTDQEFSRIYGCSKETVRVHQDQLELLVKAVGPGTETGAVCSGSGGSSQKRVELMPEIERELKWLTETAGRLPDVRRG